MDDAAHALRPDRELVAALEAANIHPLWDRYKSITPITPGAKDAPFHWRWRDVAPFAERAAAETPIEHIERRALIMVHPAFGGQTATTSNLIGAFTVLEPGDRARPHRHTAAAIRFGVESAGAYTIVNGRRCAMEAGDLILTPPMCWHGHINESGRRTVWFDAANMPLLCGLDGNFFEPGNPQAPEEFWAVDEGDERLWAEAGLAPAGVKAEGFESPKYRYPGAATRRVLDAMRPGPDGARTLRYLNPVSGGPVMSTLDCYAARIPAGTTTRPRRMTHNAVCLVVRGEGRSTIGERSFDWGPRDIFSIPHWNWASHAARGGDADLFMTTDRAVFERLGLLREEMQ